jgi:hypothetical protein
MGAPTIVLIVQLLSGVAGGNGAGALLKQFSLGWLGNSLAGLVGGALGGQLLLMLLRGAGHGTGAASGGTDVGSLVAQVVSGAVGGGLLTVIVGGLRQALNGDGLGL